MELKFIGSLSEVKAEMQEFLSDNGEEGTSAKTPSKRGGTSKTTKVEKVTADTIREAMLACDDKEGKKKLLADFGASKISELDEDKYEEFLADLKKL